MIKRIINTIILTGACSALSACSGVGHAPPIMAVQDFSEAQPYRIEPGDDLSIKFFYMQDLNESLTVRPDGMISLQLVDEVPAAGLTPSELDDTLTDLYRKKLPDEPEISVIVKDFGDQRIYVMGEVGKSGEYKLKNKMTVLQAIAAAGGFLNTANKDTVLVVRQDAQGKSFIYHANISNGNISSLKEGTAHAHLIPRDTIYVVKSGIATANLFMDQYVRQLLLFNGISLGGTAVYELNDADATD